MRYIFIGMLALTSLLACKKNKDKNTTSEGPVELKDTVLAENLSFPWEILWGPDKKLWMTQRGGDISRVDPETGAITPLYTISEVKTNGEGGLLGMVLHPDFGTSPYVYVTYNYNNGSGYKEKVVRFTYDGTTLKDPLVLLDNIGAANIHNGSRLVIIDNKIFFSTGDASNTANSQNTNALNGKIHRLNLDGSIPADNPIPNNSIWTYGHRNPQGLVYANGILYSSEHGPSTDDEINIIEKGRNYGWPNVPGFCDPGTEEGFCTANNVKEPIKAWTPTIAPSGLDFYDKNLIPQWKNSLLLATLKNSRLYQLKLNDAHSEIVETNEFYTNKYGRMRDVCISPEGKVYIITSNGTNDKIIVVDKK